MAKVLKERVRKLTCPETLEPPLELALVLRFPLNPANLFSLRTILIIPAIPSGSYLAPGLVITSISAIFAEGILCNKDFMSPPAIVDGLPSIIILT